MSAITIVRNPSLNGSVGVQPIRPIHVTEDMFDPPYIVAGAGPMASESRDRIAVWVNEGGAGGEVSR